MGWSCPEHEMDMAYANTRDEHQLNWTKAERILAKAINPDGGTNERPCPLCLADELGLQMPFCENCGNVCDYEGEPDDPEKLICTSSHCPVATLEVTDNLILDHQPEGIGYDGD